MSVTKHWLFLVGMVALATFGIMACAAPGSQAVPTASSKAAPPAQAPTATPAKGETQESKPAATTAPTKAAQSTQPAPPSATAKPTTLKYGSLGASTEGGVLVALDKGYFKEQGIEIELVPFRIPTDMIAPLGTGQLDIGLTSMSNALLAAADRGVDLKLVSGGSEVKPGWEGTWVVLRKDLADSGKVKSPTDLKGMKFAASSKGSISDLVYADLLKQGNLKPEDLEFEVLPFPDMLAAFQNKGLAVGIMIEPILAQGLQQGLFVKWKPYSGFFGGRMQTTVLVAGSSFTKDQDVARRWMVAYLKGARDYLKAFTTKEGRQQVVDTLIKYTAVKDSKLYDLIEPSYIDPNGSVVISTLEVAHKFYVDTGAYAGRKSFMDILDLSYAEYAAQKLGKQ